MKTNVIKLKFINQGIAQGKEYIYYSNNDVEVGETVNIEEGKRGVITQINVPLSEIEPFKDKAKTILGKLKVEDMDSHCGECGLIDWCGEPYELPYLCNDNRFNDTGVEKYKTMAEISKTKLDTEDYNEVLKAISDDVFKRLKEGE